jgi:hypothetical protein
MNGVPIASEHLFKLAEMEIASQPTTVSLPLFGSNIPLQVTYVQRILYADHKTSYFFRAVNQCFQQVPTSYMQTYM